MTDDGQVSEQAAALIADLTDEAAHLAAALERIAAPRRADGTYNLSREACEQIARDALGWDK